MKLRFTKMQGQGNDFVVIDGVRQSVELSAEAVRRIADRHFGIGCDQLLLVEKAAAGENDFRYRIWNADGGEVEQCGNGARCFARFVLDQGLTKKRSIRVETASGVIAPRIEANNQVSVDMGAPRFTPADIPFDSPAEHLTYALDVGGHMVEVMVLSMGNPHAVQFVDDVDAAPVATQGPLIEVDPRFPKRVNVGYVQVVDRGRARLRVWERGVGETLACGTGACAAVVAGILRGRFDETVRVDTRGGELVIRWPGGSSAVMMTGDAVRVFDGEIDL